ncbi:sulfatase [Chryseotalea sanaruensis]|uniref:Sulfatase n=2 Tax=Chryseotalea sanaruensis TaxID=2482724 RepID=A0A401UCV9_9BACT|nr:sulfatase [Chryseotalea sanaruensis]
MVVGISFLTRISLLIKSSSSVDFSFLNLAGLFLIGFFYDLVNAAYVCIPIVLYLWLVPIRIYGKAWHRFVLYGLFSVLTFLLLFNAVSEYFFWDEFNTRFNFIAVDYLVYTTEVIGNIQQSYPIGWIVLAISVISLLFVYSLKNKIKGSNIDQTLFWQRTKFVGLYTVLVAMIFFFVTNKQHRFSDNAYVNELAGNGLYELFAAYRNNELDYDQFYKRIDSKEAFALVHQLLKTSDAEFVDSNTEGINRKISNVGEEKKLNVVLISVESFSADFMASFGNQQGITPFLDSLAQRSLLFTNLYATGTRTVRGLEALSLCVPPTPGQSIVRRPHNEELFSLGKVFNEKGYESKYIYGGYGYFDNMSYFFGNNGYSVVDRSAIADEDIDYENVWGVADENLFELATREMDKSSAEKPVFAHIMTTSNHRPYTYPEGRIDIPSHTNRQGAVKYTDYSIDKFIKESSKKPWFNNTLFVIVADHCASSAGKTELPVNKYHIPMLIYAPSHIAPGRMERLMSQIDIGPTMLGLLNFSYTSKFYGYDMFKLESGRERAFISTYQSLGYIKGDKLIVLSPQLKVESFAVYGKEQVKAKPDQNTINEAIAWYQTASYSFAHGLMN